MFIFLDPIQNGSNKHSSEILPLLYISKAPIHLRHLKSHIYTDHGYPAQSSAYRYEPVYNKLAVREIKQLNTGKPGAGYLLLMWMWSGLKAGYITKTWVAHMSLWWHGLPSYLCHKRFQFLYPTQVRFTRDHQRVLQLKWIPTLFAGGTILWLILAGKNVSTFWRLAMFSPLSKICHIQHSW